MGGDGTFGDARSVKTQRPSRSWTRGAFVRHSGDAMFRLPPLRALFSFVAVVAATAPLGSCLEVPPPKDPYAPRDMVTPDGSGPEQACTPSGAEICFDAIDNNCNGIIDEGCGVHTGILQFAAAWSEPNVDVDLDVTDPSGETAQASGERTSGGLVKDRDCPKSTGECMGQNLENVYLADEKAEKGRYRIVVRLVKLNDGTPPIRVHLGARIGQRSYAYAFYLSPGEKTAEKAFEFTFDRRRRRSFPDRYGVHRVDGATRAP